MQWCLFAKWAFSKQNNMKALTDTLDSIFTLLIVFQVILQVVCYEYIN